jgi:hypothetical protein
MAIEGKRVKPGLTVTLTDSGKWTVLDRHPQPAHWWLHRWTESGEWETTYAHPRDMN